MTKDEAQQIHAERYLELDPEVRSFLESLDSEDVQTCKDIIKAYRNASVISRFFKWMTVTAFVIFMGMAGLWEKLAKLFFTKAGS